MEKQKYVGDVNRQGLKTIIIEASSEEEALEIMIEEWGEENIIIPPQLATSQAQIDSIESTW